ncbi:MAG: gliding motility-associated C-terminal domain-containing protein [Flavipsychrobacter sp.]|nr:gliding motility-associated C-terminal domain-containing protein [Flavipsychrobacter sp.]
MRQKLLSIALLFITLLFVERAAGQVTITSSDSLSCTTPCTVLTAHLVGDSPTNTGISIDDVYSGVLPIGFTFNYYGTPYTDVVIGPNGTVCFDLTLAGAYDPWPITAVLLGNPSKFNNICGPWCDIDISVPDGGTITYSLTGIAPFRKYIVTFCNDRMFSCTTQITSTQIILYETTNIIECHIATKPVCATWNSGRAIIGVQNATGTAATVAPGRDFPSVYTCTNEAWRFTPNATGSAYTVAAIPYAPVPYSSSPIHWYNTTTGAYLGAGLTQTVCPTTTTTYRAGALGCADTSFGYYTVTPAPVFTITLTSTNPSRCNLCDGSITVAGFTPGLADTITYELGGVPQPPVYATASATGTVTITGLCAGTYSNFIGRQGTCASLPAGPVVLSDPPISLTVTPGPQTICGACDGALIINGLYPSHGYTFNYSYNGTPQPPISGTTDASGSFTIPLLCEGIYGNITAAYGTCATPPVGPISLFGPAPPAGSIVSFTNPTECGKCDGTIRLKQVIPFSSDTISYLLNGVAQPRIITTAYGDSTIFLPGLCDGVYSGFSVKIGNCVTNILGTATLTDPPLTANFDTTFRLGCNGDTVFFHNHSTSAGSLYYVWDFGDGVTDTATNPYHVYDTGTFTVRLLATNHFCYDSMKMTFKIGHPLNADFTVSPAILCQNESVTFTNTSIGATNYNWTFGNGATSTISDPVNAYNITGKYNIRLIASNNIPCYDTAYKSVEVDTISGIAIDVTDSVFCAGKHITLTGIFAEGGNTGYTWTFGDSGDSLRNINPVYHSFGSTGGQYLVTLNAYYRACPDVKKTRTITTIPVPAVYLGADTSICKGSSALTLSDRFNFNNPAATWLWNTGEKTRTIQVTTPGVYYVTVTQNNCASTDSVNVENDCYVSIPNIFTPNGDGINDYFFPRTLLSRGLIEFKMYVYNRWGQIIFESQNILGSGWDGKLNGVQQPEGVYVYTIDAVFKDGQKEHHQGNVTLMR